MHIRHFLLGMKHVFRSEERGLHTHGRSEVTSTHTVQRERDENKHGVSLYGRIEPLLTELICSVRARAVDPNVDKQNHHKDHGYRVGYTKNELHLLRETCETVLTTFQFLPIVLLVLTKMIKRESHTQAAKAMIV